MGAPIKEGTTDVSVILKVIDATTGIPDQSLTHTDFALWYRREVDPGSTPLAVQDTFTEVTQTVTGAHADYGVVHLEEGNYRVDAPDAAFAAGAIAVTIGAVVTGKIVIEAYHPIVAIDPMDTVRMGLTALPDAAADAAGGLPISDAGGIDLDTILDAAVSTRMATFTQPTGFLAATFPTTVASTTNITAGTIDTVTNAVTLPTIPANWLTAAGTHADFGTEVGTAVWATAARTLTASTNFNDIAATDIVSGGAINTTAGAVDSVTLTATCTTNTDMVAAAPTAAAVADAVWDEAATGHTDAGKAGAQLWTDIDAILVDTAEIGAAGDGLTAINLPNQTMDIIGDITGNLSGSVGSVTTKTGFSLAADQSAVTIGTVTDVTNLHADSATAAAQTTAQTDLDTISNGIITGTATTGTLSTTACTSSLTGYTDDQLIGRIITFLAGPADGESSDITDYASASGLITFTALTLAPENGNAFKIT